MIKTARSSSLPEREFIRVYEIPEVYGISTDSIYRAVKLKKITLHKFGRASLIRCAELSEMITGQSQTSQ